MSRQFLGMVLYVIAAFFIFGASGTFILAANQPSQRLKIVLSVLFLAIITLVAVLIAAGNDLTGYRP